MTKGCLKGTITLSIRRWLCKCCSEAKESHTRLTSLELHTKFLSQPAMKILSSIIPHFGCFIFLCGSKIPPFHLSPLFAPLSAFLLSVISFHLQVFYLNTFNRTAQIMSIRLFLYTLVLISRDDVYIYITVLYEFLIHLWELSFPLSFCNEKRSTNFSSLSFWLSHLCIYKLLSSVPHGRK